MITYYPKTFSIPEDFRKTRVPAKFLGTVRQKIFHRKSWNTPSMHKSFGCPELFQIIGRFSTNFSALWDKNNRQKKDTTNIRKILKPEHFWNTDGFTHDDFRRCEAKNFNKMLIACYQIFFDTRTFPKNRGPPTKFFGFVRQKQSTESWYSYYPKQFDTRIFRKHRTVLPRWFLAMWDKIIRQNCDTPII